MCGIVGVWCHDRPDLTGNRFRRIVDTLAHRGPDGEGVFHDPESRLHLGHRRLAILDLSDAGAQPMATDDGEVTIVYNGEVYDFLEVRSDLESRGHRFRTDTDTEVLLAAYREWGEGMLGRLNGMWAFVLYDRRAGLLLGARDRFGVKPLLYRHADGMFAFASELKAFAAIPGVPIELDAATLAFSPMEMETTGATLLRGVRSLPPGHLVRVTADGRVQERQWWRTVDHLGEVPGDYGVQVDMLRGLLEDACRIRLRADVPIGSSLSGGVDSSAVVAAVHRVGGQAGFTADWQRIFTQGNPGTDQDESRWASRVADHLGIPLTRTDVAVEHELEDLERSILEFEGIHVLPLGLLSHYRSIRAHGVTISIDGHGGDELFGGYPRFLEAMRRRALLTARPWMWSRYAAATVTTDGRTAPVGPLLRADARGAVSPSELRRTLRERPTTMLLRTRLRRIAPLRPPSGGVLAGPDDLAERSTALAERLRQVNAEARGLGPLGSTLYVAFHHGILPSILRNFDRLSMASGVEIRSPLLDWRLVTFALALPDAARIGDGYPKRILRDAMVGMLPDEVRLRRDKKGFAPPMLDWLSRGLGDRAREVTEDVRFVGRSMWDGHAIRSRVRAAHAQQHWSAIKAEWPFIQAELLLRGLERIGSDTRS
jgi:asparagine synthase (glutamine-hydrolysing)